MPPLREKKKTKGNEKDKINKTKSPKLKLFLVIHFFFEHKETKLLMIYINYI